MSYIDGWAALNLEMPRRVPRTEYSADSNWELIKTVTEIDVNFNSSDILKQNARTAFCEQWNYDLYWMILPFTVRDIYAEMHTSMGHAVYDSGGTDYDNQVLCPFNSPEDVLNFDPWVVYGARDKNKIKEQFDIHYKFECANNPDGISMTGIYTTLVSGLIEIFGWDMLLLAMGTDSVRFGEMTNRLALWNKQYFDALAETDIPVVMCHDDIAWTSGPFCNHGWYRKYVFPNYKKLYQPILASGKKLLFTSDGNYTAFIDDIVQCGVSGFVMEPTTDMSYVAQKYGKTHVFVGNADTRILLGGTKEQIRDEVARCISIGKNCPGFFMAVGNHIPANTPVENAIYYNDVYGELSKR